MWSSPGRPDDRADVGHTAWLAPYASFARGAVVVLTHAHGAAVAEADVQELIRRESLQPQTVTILADYASIAYRCVEIDPSTGEEGPEEPPVVTPQPALSCGTAAAGTAAAGTVTSGTAAAPAPPRPYKVRTEPFVPTQPDGWPRSASAGFPWTRWATPRSSSSADCFASGFWRIARRGC